MSRIIRIAVCLMLPGIFWSSPAPAAEAIRQEATVQERIISLGRDDCKVMQHLYHLTERIGPRVSGTENLQIAVEWARDRFEDFGLADVHLERCPEVPGSYLLTSLVRLVKSPVPMYNVVADIPGVEKPDEYVIIGAHLDSDDAATGASDDGTGVAAAMEAARILIEAGARPRRTIRFILFAAEERGKLGSKAYVADHPELKPKISAMLNMDEGSDYLSGIAATDAIMEDFNRVFAPIRYLDPEMPFTIQRLAHLDQAMTSCCGGIGSSDHGPFLEAGVPAFQWVQRGRDPLPFYGHTQYDTYDRVNPEFQRHSAIVIALGALGIANLDHLLSRENLTTPSASPARGSDCCPATSNRCPASESATEKSSNCPPAKPANRQP